jgi:tetratricopeptide (TPR) repeat protein
MEAAMAKLEIAADHEPATFTALALRLANGEDAERAALSQFVAITAMRAGRDPEAKNRLPKALVAADALLTKVSDNPVALYYAGLAYGESGKAAKAQELFERAWLLVDGSPLFPDAASRQRFLKTIDEARAKYRGG